MKIFGFLTGFPPLMSCHYMIAWATVSDHHTVSDPPKSMISLSLSPDIKFSAESPVWQVQSGFSWAACRFPSLISVSDHDYKSQEQALSKGTSSRKWKVMNTMITYRSLVVFSSAERPLVWAKSCSDDPAVREAKKSPLQVELGGGLWKQ